MITKGITTKYRGASATKPSRVKALGACRSEHWDNGKLDYTLPELQATISYDCGLNAEHNHAAAAKALATKRGWSGVWFAGGKPTEDGYQYVCASDRKGVLRMMAIAGKLEGEPDRDWFLVDPVQS